jgi:hypothetical protein
LDRLRLKAPVASRKMFDRASAAVRHAFGGDDAVSRRFNRPYEKMEGVTPSDVPEQADIRVQPSVSASSTLSPAGASSVCRYASMPMPALRVGK